MYHLFPAVYHPGARFARPFPLAFCRAAGYTWENAKRSASINKKDRIHDWRKLKWPFTVTFLYYSILSLYTGMAEQSGEGFLAMFAIVLIVDAVAYLCYCFFLSKDAEDMQKLWFVFILAYVLVSTEQLSILWQMMTARAAGA